MNIFKEVMSYYTNILVKAKQHQIALGIPLEVAFFVTQKQLWSAQSVYDELKKSKNFTPKIVVFPNHEDKVSTRVATCKDNYNFFYSNDMEVIFGYDTLNNEYYDFEEIGADLVFFDQPYVNLPRKLSWVTLYKKALICYIPYGYKIANFYDAHFNMDLQNYCWTIFAESQWHKEQFVKYGAHDGINVVVSGYPKLDTYNDVVYSNSHWKMLPTTIKKVIWAPHWSIDTINYSTFHINYRFFLNLASNNKLITWVFKPHQRLKYHLIESNFMSDKEVQEYYEAWDTLDNAYYYNESDYFDIFKTSDALITDCGSFLAEYLPTAKPIIHLVNTKSNGYNEIGEKLTSTYYKAFSISDIKQIISEVIIGNNDYLIEKRLSSLYLVQPNINGAGKYIIDYLNKTLAENINDDT